jgi:hypothetical protein
MGNIDDPSVVRHPQLSSVASMYQNSCKMKSYFEMYRVAATSASLQRVSTQALGTTATTSSPGHIADSKTRKRMF